MPDNWLSLQIAVKKSQQSELLQSEYTLQYKMRFWNKNDVYSQYIETPYEYECVSGGSTFWRPWKTEGLLLCRYSKSPDFSVAAPQ